MDLKTDAIKSLLAVMDMPRAQQSGICALAILRMANIKPNSSWSKATAEWVRIHDIIAFANTNYRTTYAENSRETFRKQALHHFRTAAIIEDNGKATNSPNYRYRLTKEFLTVIRSIDKHPLDENDALKRFMKKHESLASLYGSKKKMQKMPVMVGGVNYELSPGKHNQLQKSILEEFAPRFAPSARCLYMGDTAKKELVKDEDTLTRLGFNITPATKMPDVVLYRADKDWIYFVEAVTSVGPMSPDRIHELQQLTKNVKASKIFVTAFPDFNIYKRFSQKLAWETEVWLADAPDHMIHLNGDKFIGPRY